MCPEMRKPEELGLSCWFPKASKIKVQNFKKKKKKKDKKQWDEMVPVKACRSLQSGLTKISQ